MAGVKGKSGRPGGNPDLQTHQFSTEREEALTAKLTLRVAPSMMDALKLQDNWQELARNAIALALQNTENHSENF
jgi:hypothetical protein